MNFKTLPVPTPSTPAPSLINPSVGGQVTQAFWASLFSSEQWGRYQHPPWGILKG